jgi:para-nitrobenzyl esterase
MTGIPQLDKKLTRRSLLSGAVTFGGGAALATAVPSLALPVAAPAVINSRQRQHAITASASQNVVETESGKLYGYARDGVIGYRGIPYGATTANAWRFMPTQKVTPWTGVRSALYWGWSSPTTQNCTVAGRRTSWAHDDEAFMFEWEDGQPSEDCLRLNVWTPALDHKKRAVMFWIHGGGMTAGSSNELRAYDGENLARQEDVVVVSINHRLGVLGFLNLMEYGEQYANSPNVSMLDIVAALQWVKTNIGNFGGNPDCVMIFGQSGGGGKVGTIMGMPTAKGLFHRASIQSGSSLHQVTMEGSLKVAHATLAELGITKDNIQKLHTDFTYQQIVEAGMVGQQKASAGDPPLVPGERGAGWGPTVDGRLLPRHTWDPAAPEASADVPLLIGNVLNEQGNSVQMGDARLEVIDLAEAQRHLPAVMGEHRGNVLRVAQKLFPKAKPFDLYSRCSGMINQMLAYKQAQLKTQQGKAPAYLYRFEWQSPMCDGRARAFHTSELPFCFHNASLCAKITGDTPEAHELAGRVAGAWAAFAKTGNPNHAGIPKWEAFNNSVPTMIFDTKCTASNDPDAELRKAEMEAIGL